MPSCCDFSCENKKSIIKIIRFLLLTFLFTGSIRADSTKTAAGLILIKGLNGNPDGQFWSPGEADFALRKHAFQGGWFWHEGEESTIRSLDDLMERYVQTVGRNTNMLLGIVIDDQGLVPEADMERLEEFGSEVEKQFSKILGQTQGTGNLYEIDFEKSQKVKHVLIQEDISKGERVREYKLYGKEGGEWKLVNTGSSIGHKRIEVLNKGNYSGIKLEVVSSEGNPIIKKLECY